MFDGLCRNAELSLPAEDATVRLNFTSHILFKNRANLLTAERIDFVQFCTKKIPQTILFDESIYKHKHLTFINANKKNLKKGKDKRQSSKGRGKGAMCQVVGRSTTSEAGGS